MGHFAKIEDGKVTQVLVVNNETLGYLEFPESEVVGQEFLASIGFEGTWLQTSYNKNFRANYASYGHTYDEEKDVFIPQKLYKSWVLNEEDYQWYPPIPMPTIEDNSDQRYYLWDESTVSWKLIIPE